MVRFPSEWRHSYGVNLVSAFPPALGARFRWYERVTPQPTFSAVLAQILARDPDFRAHHVDDTLRVVTHEGEYAAWVALEGRRQGREARRYVGAVFLDQFAGVLDCIAVMPPHFAELRELSQQLLRSATFHLGARPRPFYYVPPRGWQAIPSGASTTWYPPDFPNNRANIAIPHAMQLTAPAPVALEAALAELPAGIELAGSEHAAFRSDAGHEGIHATVFGTRNGEPIARQLVVFAVEQHGYAMRLETASPAGLPAAREALVALARTFRPLPNADETRLGRAFDHGSTDFDHWAT